MRDTKLLLRETRDRIHPPSDVLEMIDRRRRRKERVRRTSAAVVAIVVAFIGLGGWFVWDSPGSTPAEDGTPTPTAPESVQRRDGEYLRCDVGCVAVDPRSGDTRLIVEGRVPGKIVNAAWSDDGRWLAFEVAGCGLWVSETAGAERRLVEDPPCTVDDFGVWLWAWSPTGNRLAAELVSGDEDSLVIIDAATGEVIDLGRAVGDLTTLAWSPDGTRVAYGTLLGGPSRNGAMYVVDVADGSTTLLAQDFGYLYGIGGSTIHWSPDGEHLAAIAAPGRPAELVLMRSDGSGRRTIRDHVQDAAWSPDGSRVAFATFSGQGEERMIRIWTISPEDAEPLLVHEEQSSMTHETADLVWSPDGTRIAYTVAMLDGRIVDKVVPSDGSSAPVEVERSLHLSWTDGSYFCHCYG